MLLILTTKQEWQDERRLILRDGQSATVGATEWADFCVSNDPGMADQHFEVVCDSRGGSLRKLTPDAQLEVNGVAVQECPLRPGDQLLAGQTVFEVEVSGVDHQSNADVEPSETRPSEKVLGTVGGAKRREKGGPTAKDICAFVELSEAATDLLTPEISPNAFFQMLDAREMYEDAVKFLSAWLPKQVAIQWAFLCLRARHEEMADPQREAFAAAEQWLLDPIESKRKQAADIAESLEYKGAASWLALAVGWSGGSVAAPSAPPVPPPDEIVGQAVLVSLRLAAMEEGAEQSGERYQSFLDIGKQLMVESGFQARPCHA